MAYDPSEGLINGANLVGGLVAQGQKTAGYVDGMFDAHARRAAGDAIANGDNNTAAGLLGARGFLDEAQALKDRAAASSTLSSINSKDFGAAKTTAAAAGDPALLNTATTAEQADRTARTAWMAHAADALLQIKDPARRQAALESQIKPTLKAMGLSDDQLASIGAQSLTDEGLQTFKATLGQMGKLDIQKLDDGSIVGIDQAGGVKILHQGAAKGVVVGKNVINPVTGEVIYEGPNLEKLGADETLVDAGGGSGAAAPRNERNHNPGNIEDGTFAQSLPGYAGTDGRFAKFDSPEAGAKAQVALLGSYGKRGINTVSGIINRWAPPSDNNPTDDYVKFVADKVGVKPDQKLDMTDTGTLSDIASAIKAFEGSGKSASNSSARVLAVGKDKGDDGNLSDDAVEQAAERYIVNGALPPMGQGKTGTQNRDKILNKAAEMEKSTGRTGAEAVAAWSGVKGNVAALSKLTQTRSMVESFESTARKNADLMLSLAPKGGGQTGAPVVNRWLQAGRKQIAGDPDVANFDIALGTFADEYAKIVSGATGSQGSTDASRKEAYDRLSKYATQSQLQGGIATMKKEMANRIESMKEQEAAAKAAISGGTGAPKPAATVAPRPEGWSKLLPAPQLATAKKYAGATAPGGSQQNPFVPTSQAQFDHLASGQWFINPADGHPMMKK
jgi:hypothetical protein